jgi:hypothetical protein
MLGFVLLILLFFPPFLDQKAGAPVGARMPATSC